MGQKIKGTKQAKLFLNILMAFAFVFAYATNAAGMCGDLNFDNKIDDFDIFIAAQGSLGTLKLSSEQALRADVAVTGRVPDGRMMSNDFVMIREAAKGRITLVCNEPAPAPVVEAPVALVVTPLENVERLDTVPFAAAGGGQMLVVRGQAIVALAPGATEAALAVAVNQLGGTVAAADAGLGIYLVQLPAGADLGAALAALGAAQGVAGAVPNVVFSTLGLTPDDPAFASGDVAKNWGFTSAKAPEAWERASKLPDAGAPVVAVLDTGVDSASQEWTGRLLEGADFTGTGAAGVDGNGHGTHAAGVIGAAGNNGYGIAGVCWSCKVLPVKVCDAAGACPLYSVIKGIDYASANGAKVINISIAARAEAGSDPAKLLGGAVERAKAGGALVVAAAGNSSTDAGQTIPAALPGVLGVAAVDANGALGSFSNFGADAEIAAPGVKIYSILPGGGADFKDGTSGAAAFVSGAAGLLLSKYPALTSDQVVAALKSGEVAVSTGKALGGGLLDIDRALASLAPAQPVVENGNTNATTQNDVAVDQSPAETQTQTETQNEPAAATATETQVENSGPQAGEAQPPAEATATENINNEGQTQTTATETQTGAGQGDGQAENDTTQAETQTGTAVENATGTQTQNNTAQEPAAETPSGDNENENVENAGAQGAPPAETPQVGAVQTPAGSSQNDTTATGTAGGAPEAATAAEEQSATAPVEPAGVATAAEEARATEPVVAEPQPEPPAAPQPPAVPDFMLGIAASANGTPCTTDWPQYRCNNNHSGDYSLGSFSTKLANIWTYTVTGDSGIYSSPAVSGGTVYFGTWSGKVIALNGSSTSSTGTLVWSYTTGGNVYSSPAVGNGMVYIGSGDGKIYALSAATGGLIWSTSTGAAIKYSSPALNSGRVFIGSNDGKMYAVNAWTGAGLWSYTTGGAIDTSPAVAGSRVFFGSDDGKMYAVSETTGALSWGSAYTTGGAIKSSPAVANGKVYFGSNDKKVYALDEVTGLAVAGYTPYTTGDIVTSSPSVTGGKIYVASEDGSVYQLDETTGAKTAQYTTTLLQRSSPAVSSQTTFIGMYDNTTLVRGLYTSSSLSSKWFFSVSGAHAQSSPAVAGNKVFIGGDDSKLYAFEDNITPTVSSVTFNPIGIPADNTTTTTVTAVVADGNGKNDINTVTINLTSIGGSAAASLYDNGTNGDVTSGDGTYTSNAIKAAVGTANATYTLTVTVTDKQSVTGTGTGQLTVSSTNVAPGVSGCAFSPSSIAADGTTAATLTCTATDTNGNLSTVNANLTALGGSATTIMLDDGASGDGAAGDGVYGATGITAANGTTPATYTITVTAKDTWNASGSATGALGITAPVVNVAPIASNASFTPSSVAADGTSTTTLKVSVTDGNGAANILSVTANLSTIGGSAAAALFDNGTNGDTVSGDATYTLSNITITAGTAAGNYSVGITATDQSGATGTATATVTVPAANVAPVVSCSFGGVTSLPADGSTAATLTCTVTDANSNLSTVNVNLSTIGGSASSAMTNNPGGSNTYTKSVVVAVGITPNATYTLTITGTDTQSAAGTGTVQLLVTSSTTTNGTACDTTWPQYRCNTHHSGESNTTITFPISKKWDYTTGGVVESSPAMDATYIYIGSSDGYVYAIKQTDKSILWSYNTGYPVTTAPALNSGTLYVAAGAKLLTLNATTGAAGWSVTATDTVNSPVVSASDNAVVISSQDGYLTAYTLTGTLKWRKSPGGLITAAPAVADGYACVGTKSGKMSCYLVSDGTQVWTVTMTGSIDVAAAIGAGKVFFGAGNSFYAYKETALSQIWTTAIGAQLSAPPTISGNTVYFPATNKYVYAFDANVTGTVLSSTALWNKLFGGQANSAPAVAGGKLYFGAQDNNFYILNTSNGTTYTSFSAGGQINSSPAVANGRVAFGSKDGKVYLYETAATPTVTAVTFTPSYIPASGAGTTKVTATVSDFNGSADIAAVTVNLTPIGGSSAAAMYDDGTNGDTTAGDGIYSLSGISCSGGGCTAATQTITVSAGDKSAATGTAAASLLVNASPVVNSCSYAASSIAAGGAGSVLSCNVTDGNSNLTGVTVNLTTLGGSAAAAMTNNPGGSATWTYTVTAVASTAAGTYTPLVTATDGTGATGTRSTSISVYDPAPAVSSCAFSPTSIQADNSQSTTLTCTVTDSNSNLSSVVVNLTSIGGSAATALTNSSGSTWTKTLIKAATNTVVPSTFTMTITATDGGGSSGTSSAQIAVTDPRPVVGSCDFSPTSVMANGASSTTLTCLGVSDANNNLSTVTVNLTPLGGSATATMTNTPPGSTTYVRTVTVAPVSAYALPHTFFQANGSGILVTATDAVGGTGGSYATTLTATSAPPSISGCSFSPSSIQTNGRATTTLTCTVSDINFDIATSSVYANLSALGGGTVDVLTYVSGTTWRRQNITAATSTSSALGAKTIQVYAFDVGGSFSNTSAGLTITDPLPVVDGCTFSPTSLTSDGTATSTLTCTVIDPNGNTASVLANLSSFGGSAAAALTKTATLSWQKTTWQLSGITAPLQMSPPAYTTPGVYTSTITATDSATPSAGAGTNTANITLTDPKPVVSGCVFTPNSIDADGASTTVLTCTVTDLSNNISSVTVNLATKLGGSSTAALTNTGGNTWTRTGITVPPTVTPGGPYSSTVTATDAYSGTGTSTVLLTVTDPRPVLSNCAFSPNSIPADGTTTTTLTCTAVDPNNNITTITADLSAFGGGASDTLTNTGGTTYQRTGILAATDTTPFGTYTVTVTALDVTNGVGTSTIPLKITDVPPVVSGCSYSPASVPADGVTTTTLTCTVTDINNNLGTVVVNLSGIGGNPAGFMSNTSGSTYQRSVITVPPQISGAYTTPGSYNTQVKALDSSNNAGYATPALVVTDPAPVFTGCSFSPTSVDADGAATTTLTCTITDPTNNVATVTVNLTSVGDGASATLTFVSGTTWRRTGISVPPSVTPGSFSLVATAQDAYANSATSAVSLIVTDPKPVVSNCSFSPSSVPADGTTTTTLTCTATDVNNNLSTVKVNLTAIGGSSAQSLTASGGGIYTATGIKAATNTAVLASNTLTVTATDLAGGAGTGSVSLKVTDVAPVVSSCSFSPTTVQADNSQTTVLTCTVSDVNNNVSSVKADLTPIGGSATTTLTFVSGTTWRNSSVKAALTAPQATHTIVITASDTANSASSTAQIRVTDPAPVVSGCSFTPSSIPGDGTTATVLKCTVTDANNNVTSVTANLSTLGGSTATAMFDDGAHGDGAAGDKVYAINGLTAATSTTPPAKTLSTIVVTAVDASGGTSGAVASALTVTDPKPVVATCTYSPTSVPANASDTFSVQCTVTDANNNVVATGGVTINMVPLGGSSSTALTSMGGGVYKATGLKAAVGTPLATTSMYVCAVDSSGGLGCLQPSILVTDPPPSISSCTLTPSSIQADGVDATVLSCTVVDLNSNLSTVTADLTAFGGSATASLTNAGGGVWKRTGITAGVTIPITTYPIVATAKDSAGGSATKSVTLTVTDPKPAVTGCAFTPSSITADGSATSTLSCTVTDANSNLTTVTANLSAIGGGAVSALTDMGGGIWTKSGISVPLGYTPSSISVLVTGTDATGGTGTGTAALTYTDPVPVVSGCYLSPSSVMADGASVGYIYCTVTDQTNNLSSVNADLTPFGQNPAALFTNVSGSTYRRQFTIPVTASIATYTIVVTGTDSYGGKGTGTVAVLPGDPAPVVSGCSYSPASIQADATTVTALTCTVTDANSNTASVTVDLSPIGGGATAALTLVSGTTWKRTGITASLTTLAGSYSPVVTAKDASGGSGTSTVALNVTDPVPVVGACTFTPSSIPADAVTTSLLSCSVTDVNNNISTVKVDLTGLGGSSATALAQTATNTWTVTITAATSTTVPKTFSTILVTAKDASGGSSSNYTSSLTVTDPAPKVSGCSFTPSSIQANASETTALQCTVTDANNNIKLVYANMSALGGGTTDALTLVSGTTWKRSGITAAGATSLATHTISIYAFDNSNGNGSATAAVKVTDPRPTVTGCSFTPSTIMSDGVSTSTLTCTVTDMNNNLTGVTADLTNVGGSAVAALTNAGGGTWTRTDVTAPVSAASGSYSVTVTATDAAAGTGTSSTALKVGDPSPVVTNCTFTPSTLAANGTATSTLSCTVTDANNNVSTVKADLSGIGGGSAVSLSNTGGSTWSKTGVTVTTTTTAGAKSISVVATDAAAGTGTGTAALTVTDPAPVVSGCTITPSSLDADGSTKATLQCTVTDGNNNLSTVTADLTQVGGSATAALTNAGGGVWKNTAVSVATSTTIAVKTITVTGTDASGGTGTASVSLTVKDPKPAVSSCAFTPSSVPADGSTSTVLKCTVTDANGNISTVSANMTAAGGSAAAALSAAGGNYWSATQTVAVGVTAGTYSIVVTGTDASGGAASSTAALTVTDPKPVVSGCSFSPSSIAADGAATATLSCTVTDLSNNISAVTVNLASFGGSASTAMVNSGGGVWQKTGITVTGLAPTATYTVTVTATDLAGGTGSGTATLGITNAPPVMSSCAFVPNKVTADGESATVLTCTVVDFSGQSDIKSVTANLSSVGGSASTTMTATVSGGSTFAKTNIIPAVGTASGTYTITITAVDNSNGTTTATASLGIVPAPPQLVYKQACAVPPAGRWVAHNVAGMLNAPLDATVNSANGDFIVADTGNNRVSVFNSSCGFVRVFGSLGGSDGQFQAPKGIVYNPTNSYIYVIDAYNRVQYFTTAGVFVGKWAVSGPTSIAVDTAGNIYVGTGTGVSKYTSTGTLVKSWSAPKPSGLDIDSAGIVYLSDQASNAIVTLDTASGATATIVMSGTTSGSVKTPWGVSVDNTFLSVAVADYGNNRVQRFNSGGSYQQKFSTYGAGTGMVNYPKGVAPTPSGGLVIVDTLNNRIQEYIPQ